MFDSLFVFRGLRRIFLISFAMLLGFHGISSAQVAFNWETSTTGEPVAPNIPYGIISCSTGGMVEASANAENGTGIEQLDGLEGTPSDSQQWRFEPTGDGFYIIRNACTGLVLDANPDGSWPVKVWDYSGIPWHHWRIVPCGYAKYKLQNRHTGKYLTIGYLSSDKGMTIGQWEDVGPHDGQLFRLVFVLGDLDNHYAIKSKAVADCGLDYVLDNLYASQSPGAVIGQCSYWAGQNQHFAFEQPGNGEIGVIIRNCTRGAVLDGYPYNNEYEVKLWNDYFSASWQRWWVEHVSGPWFRIRNEHTGKHLTMNWFAHWPWTPQDQRPILIQYWNCGDHPGQLWRFDKAAISDNF